MSTRVQPAMLSNRPITYLNEYYTPPGVEYREIPLGGEPTFRMETLYPTTQVRAFETLFTEAIIENEIRDEIKPRSSSPKRHKTRKPVKQYSRCSSYDSHRSSPSIGTGKVNSEILAADRYTAEKEKILHRAARDLSKVEREYELSRQAQRSTPSKRSRSVSRKKEAKHSREKSKPRSIVAPSSVSPPVPVIQSRNVSSTTQGSGLVGTTHYYFHQFPALATTKTNPFSPVKKRGGTMTALQTDGQMAGGTSIHLTALSAHPSEFISVSRPKSVGRSEVHQKESQVTPRPVVESPRPVYNGVSTSSYQVPGNAPPSFPMPASYQAVLVPPAEPVPFENSTFMPKTVQQNSLQLTAPMQQASMQKAFSSSEYVPLPYAEAGPVVEHARGESVEYKTRGVSDAVSSSRMSSYSVSLDIAPAPERKSFCC